jgi:hypothetical protein
MKRERIRWNLAKSPFFHKHIMNRAISEIGYRNVPGRQEIHFLLYYRILGKCCPRKSSCRRGRHPGLSNVRPSLQPGPLLRRGDVDLLSPWFVPHEPWLLLPLPHYHHLTVYHHPLLLYQQNIIPRRGPAYIHLNLLPFYSRHQAFGCLYLSIRLHQR